MFSYLRNFNRAILLIILSDVFTWGFYGVLSVLTGIYLSAKIEGDIPAIMGLGIFIYFVTRAATNIPVSKILDGIPGNRDEATAIMFGSFLMGFPYVLYPLITTPLTYYVFQIIFGVGAAMQVMASRKIVALHLDKNREGEEYSVQDITYCLFIAIAGLVGGIISGISLQWFSIVFVVFGLLIISSGIWAMIYIRRFYPERKPLVTIAVDFFRQRLKG